MPKKIYKIKAIEIINTYSAKEKKDFRLFLSSPYYNTNKALPKLYDAIIKNEKKILTDGISEKELYCKAFQTDKFSYSNLRNLMSSLLHLCEQFLIIDSSKNYSEYKFQNDVKALKQYSLRFLDQNFQLKFRKVNKQLNYKYLGYKYFEHKRKLNYELDRFFFLRQNYGKRIDSLVETGINNICSMFSSLSENILTHDYINRTFNHKPPVNPSLSLLNNLNINAFLDELKDIDQLSYNHIQTELRFIKLVLNPSDFENYYLLKKFIFGNINAFSNSEKYFHTTRLLSFIINRFQNGMENLQYEIAEFRKFQLKNIDYGSEGVDSLNMAVFVDMLDVFLNTEGLKFSESFVKGNIDKVESVNRKNAFNYSMARIAVKKKNYEKAIGHLGKLKLTDSIFKIKMKLLLIEIYYEQGYFESGLASIDTLKHFMKKSKDLNDNLKHRFNELIKITESIYKIRINPEKFGMFEIEKLLSRRLREVRKVSSWYEIKLEELKKYYTGKKQLTLTG